MKTHNGISIAAGLLAIAALLPGAAGAEAILHGRVSFDTGGVLVKGVEESDWTDASVNTLVLPNDTLWVDNGGTAEVEFSGGTFLRMADGSKAEIVSLPPNGVIRGWVGSFYLHRLNRSQGDFVFQTPAGIIEIEKDAMVRVDILEEGITTVSTRWGRATVRTDAGGTVYAYAGKRVFIETGLLPSEPVPFDRSDEDAFDRWNRERAEYLATGSTQTPVEIGNDTLGVTDLDRYGEWVTVDSRPVWRPTVVVDYTPYRYGYWHHVGPVGNVWVGNYPFSYITTHYGYWDYAPRYGWVWSYDRVWSPAWCATVRYGDYFVWAPINRYHRPVYPTTSAHFSIGGVSFGYYGTSIAHVSHLYSGPSYVHFANHDPFRRYYGSGNININIWNINTGSRRPHVRVPYREDSVFTVRDYTPRRSIRGSSTLFASNRSASERVQRLESSTRNSFSRGGRTGGEFVRTDTARIDRGNRTRNVRLTESAPEYSRASRSNPIVASSTRDRAGSGSITRSGGTRDRQDSTRGAVTTRGGSDTPGIERGVRTSTRGDAGDRDSTSTASIRTRSRSADNNDSTATSGIRTRSRSTSTGSSGDRSTGRTEARSDFDESPLRMHTRPNTRTSAPQGRETPTSVDRSGVRASTSDSGRTSPRSTASSTRTQVRESSPRVNIAPDRVTTRGNSGSSAASRSSRTTTTRPSVSSSRSTSTRLSTPSRSNTSRSQVDTPSRTSSSESRSRVIERNTPSTSRSYTAPSRDRGSSRSFTPPSSTRSSSSSRSYTAPSRDSGSSRSFTAPSRDRSSSSSSRSFTAPSRDRSSSSSSRSFTAPSRDSGSSRSYTAPSRSSSSSRSFSAPSRSSSSSRSFSAPSRGSSGRDSGISSRSSGSRSVSSGRSSSRGR